MKKKLLLILLLLCSLFLVASCGGDDEQAANPYERGTVSDEGFESEWIGLKWSKPEEMVMMTDEELDTLMEESLGIAFGEDGEELLDYAQLTSVYEMMATTLTGTPNIIILTEKLALQNISESQYLEAVEEGLAYSEGEYVGGDIETTTIAGLDFTVQPYSVSMQGVDILQKYFVRKQDDRMISIIITYFAEDDCQTLLDCFEAFSTENQEGE